MKWLSNYLLILETCHPFLDYVGDEPEWKLCWPSWSSGAKQKAERTCNFWDLLPGVLRCSASWEDLNDLLEFITPRIQAHEQVATMCKSMKPIISTAKACSLCNSPLTITYMYRDYKHLWGRMCLRFTIKLFPFFRIPLGRLPIKTNKEQLDLV